MLILPRSNLLYENLSVEKISLPDAIQKMGTGGFTGYMGYRSGNSEAYLLFIKGTLVSALVLEGIHRKSGFNAIVRLFHHAINEGGFIDVYRMTPDIAVCTNALLHGSHIIKPQLVKNTDLKGTMANLSSLPLTGTLLFSAPERSAMIFYKAGLPIGFYNNTALEIETSPVESQKVASLPDAMIEVVSTPPLDELLHHNLLETLNIAHLWEAEKTRLSTREKEHGKPKESEQASSAEIPPTKAEISDERHLLLDEIVEDIKEVAKAYLGRPGADLVVTLLNKAGGKAVLLNTDKTATFLNLLTSESSAIDPEARIDEMVDLIRSEIAGRLAL